MLPTRLAVWTAAALCVACSSPPPPAPAPNPNALPWPTAPPVATAPAQVQPLTPKEIAKSAAKSVVRLEGERNLGTGFVVQADGWIATNLHVVAPAANMRAVFGDGRKFAVVEVLGFDPERDVALLRIEADKLPVLPLGGDVSAGERVVAIGHPLGLSNTVSDGLISAVRVIAPDVSLLQISAPIAPGSSGGPLFNERGEVIGIATAVLREGQNLNFGVPIAYLKKLMASPTPTTFSAFHAALKRNRDPAPARPRLPSVVRDVPTHPLTLLDKCSTDEVRSIARRIAEAIALGAPIYNAGNFRACYHIYLGASLDLEKELSASCNGPKGALKTARDKATAAADAHASAWAMRDGFDGLIDVIRRKLRP